MGVSGGILWSINTVGGGGWPFVFLFLLSVLVHAPLEAGMGRKKWSVGISMMRTDTIFINESCTNNRIQRPFEINLSQSCL